jgi:hypothetical protein
MYIKENLHVYLHEFQDKLIDKQYYEDRNFLFSLLGAGIAESV